MNDDHDELIETVKKILSRMRRLIKKQKQIGKLVFRFCSWKLAAERKCLKQFIENKDVINVTDFISGGQLALKPSSDTSW